MFMLYNVNNLCIKEWDLNKLLSIYLSIYLHIYLHIYLSIYLHIYLSTRTTVYYVLFSLLWVTAEKTEHNHQLC